jgi:hypothetical protein
MSTRVAAEEARATEANRASNHITRALHKRTPESCQDPAAYPRCRNSREYPIHRDQPAPVHKSRPRDTMPPISQGLAGYESPHDCFMRSVNRRAQRIWFTRRTWRYVTTYLQTCRPSLGIVAAAALRAAHVFSSLQPWSGVDGLTGSQKYTPPFFLMSALTTCRHFRNPEPTSLMARGPLGEGRQNACGLCARWRGVIREHTSGDGENRSGVACHATSKALRPPPRYHYERGALQHLVRMAAGETYTWQGR